jgi:hypothetical protein
LGSVASGSVAATAGAETAIAGSGSLAVLDRRVEATVHAVQVDDHGRPIYRIDFVNPRNGRIKSTWITHLQALRSIARSRRRGRA